MTTSSLIISPMLVISKTISIKKTPTEACNKVCKAKVSWEYSTSTIYGIGSQPGAQCNHGVLK